MSPSSLPTPYLLVDGAALTRNLERMAQFTSASGVGLRPHVKSHKSVAIAARQRELGAIGFMCATLTEAEQLVGAGLDEIVVASQLAGLVALDRVCQLARAATVTVFVDDADAVAALGRRAAAARVEVGALVEVDVGMRRGGVRSPDTLRTVARAVCAAPSLTLRGVAGWEGHCADEPDRAVRAAAVAEVIATLRAAADAARVVDASATTVSAGGTGTFDLTGCAEVVTEISPGSYVLMDDFHAPVAEGFERALVVVATVVGVHGDLVLLDAGRKALDCTLGTPSLALATAGRRVTPSFVHEELSGWRPGTRTGFGLGDTVEVLAAYAPGTVVLHERLVVDCGTHLESWRTMPRHGTGAADNPATAQPGLTSGTER